MYECAAPSSGGTVLKEGSLFRRGVYVSMGECGPINIINVKRSHVG